MNDEERRMMRERLHHADQLATSLALLIDDKKLVKAQNTVSIAIWDESKKEFFTLRGLSSHNEAQARQIKDLLLELLTARGQTIQDELDAV